MRKKFMVIATLTALFACNNEVSLVFSEFNLEFSENAIIEINVPKSDGDQVISDSINSKIENHIANALNFSEDDSQILLLDDAIQKFDTTYKEFKDDFEESDLTWEALFDGEVIYQSSEVISIAINSYLNTGGAHGNMNITFLNFDSKNGAVLEIDDLISDKMAFTVIAKKQFMLETQSNDTFGNYFFDEDFHLPANIGFNDEGVILFYNVYEIASYAIGVTEFTIPFDKVQSYLKVR